MDLEFKKLYDDVELPAVQTEGSAGCDLHAYIPSDPKDPKLVVPGKTVVINTGLSVAIPEGYFGAIFPRSGLAVKKGLRLANSVAVIDPDYRGEIMVALFNDSARPCEIKNGDRIAQFILIPYEKINWVQKDTLSETARNTGGFGSTGV